MEELSIRGMKNLIKDNTEKRASRGAAEELGTILETFAGDVAEEAIHLAEQDGLKTVRRGHVKEGLH